MAAPIWSEEILDTAREAFDRGCSFSQIAHEIAERHGVVFSRNAVIGKAGRLGWTRLLAKAPLTRWPRQATKEKTKAPVDALPFVPRVDEITPLHLKLLDLKSTSCRWPYGDTDFTFCGCEKAPESSYCAAHKVLSIRPRT